MRIKRDKIRNSKFEIRNSYRAFTIVELAISVMLFAISITVALFATVGTNSLIARTDVRSAVAESSRTVADVMRRVSSNAAVGTVAELLPYTEDNYSYAGIRVKGFSAEHGSSACQVVGRANPEPNPLNPSEEIYTLALNGSVVAYWIYELDSTLNCPTLGSTNPIYQNRLTSDKAKMTDFEVKLVNFPCSSGCTGFKQVLRYRFGIESTIKLSGGTREAQLPSLATVDSLPIGLINEDVAAPVVITTTLNEGTINAPYSQDILAQYGVTPYTWSKTTGILPTGLTLTQFDTKYVLAGTPTQLGNFSFTVKVLDANNNFDTQILTVTINSVGTTLTIQENPAPPGGMTGQSYSHQFYATGGNPPYVNWIKTAGTWPSGLTFSSTGLLSGTPTIAGNYPNITVQVTDIAAHTDTFTFNINILQGASGLTLSPTPAPPQGTANMPYSYNFNSNVSGGTMPYSNWQIITGTVPLGCTNGSLNSSSGIFSCTPTTNGNYTFTVQVRDAVFATTTQQYTIVIGTGTELPPEGEGV